MMRRRLRACRSFQWVRSHTFAAPSMSPKDPQSGRKSQGARILRTFLARELLLPHRDPADLFLAATTRALGLTIVTADERQLDFGDRATLPNRSQAGGTCRAMRGHPPEVLDANLCGLPQNEPYEILKMRVNPQKETWPQFHASFRERES